MVGRCDSKPGRTDAILAAAAAAHRWLFLIHLFLGNNGRFTPLMSEMLLDTLNTGVPSYRPTVGSCSAQRGVQYRVQQAVFLAAE